MRNIYSSIDIGTDTIKLVTLEAFHDKYNVLAATQPAPGHCFAMFILRFSGGGDKQPPSSVISPLQYPQSPCLPSLTGNTERQAAAPFHPYESRQSDAELTE